MANGAQAAQAEQAEQAGGLAAGMAAAAAIAALLMAGFWLLIPQQFADPFIRHDDYPALLARGDLYWWKTLAKGRWVTWAWAERGALTEPRTIWAIYLGLWCWASACTAIGIFREKAPSAATAGDAAGIRPAALFGAPVAAIGLAAMPQTAFISAWPAATLPAVAALAVFASVAAFGSRRAMLWALVLLTPVAAMSHTTYPLLMLLVAMAAGRPGRGRWEAVGPVAASLLGLALTAVLVASINGAVHGVWGIRTGSWLAERPAEDLAGLLANLALAADWLATVTLQMALASPLALALMAALSALAALILARDDPGGLWRLLLGLAVAVGIGIAPTVLKGIETPSRATGYLWMAPVVLFALVLRGTGRPARRALFAVAILVFAGGAGLYWRTFYERIAPGYQAQSRAMAAEIVRVIVRVAGGGDGEGRDLSPDQGRLLIAGQVHGLPWAQILQSGTALAFRLEMLTGLETHLCQSQTQDIVTVVTGARDLLAEENFADWAAHYAATENACAGMGGAMSALSPWPQRPYLGEIAPGIIGLRLPERRIADAPP